MMETLAKSVDEVRSRLDDVEAQVKELREMLPKIAAERREEKWVHDIEGVMEEWYCRVNHAVIVSASRGEQLIEGHDKPEPWSWINGGSIEGLTRLPTAKVMFALSPFSSEQKLKILLQLDKYPKSATDLSNATGLQGGSYTTTWMNS